MNDFWWWYLGICGGLLVVSLLVGFFGWCAARKTDKRFADIRSHRQNDYREKVISTIEEVEDLQKKLCACKDNMCCYRMRRWTYQKLVCAAIFNEKSKRSYVFRDEKITRYVRLKRQIRDILNLLDSLYPLQESAVLPKESMSRAKVFLNAGGCFFSLIVVVQTIITFFVFLLAWALWVCMNLMLGLVQPVDTFVVNAELIRDETVSSVSFVQEIASLPLGNYLLGALLIAAMSVAIVFLQKVIKFVIIQCDIFFVAHRSLVHIILVDRLNRNQIFEEFVSLVQLVRRKTSAGFLNNILDKIAD